MRMRSLALIAAAAPLLAFVPGGASAAAHSVLTNGRVGGPSVRVGSILRARLSGTAAFLVPGTMAGVRCRRAEVTDRVVRNPVAPGTAVERLIGQTFGRCSSSIPGTTGVKSVRVLGLPYRTTIRDSAGNPVTIFRARTQLTLRTVVGTLTCAYGAARLRGRADNAGSRIIFVGQLFRLTSGSAACPKGGSFSAAFGPVTNVSAHGLPHVFVS